MSNLLVRWVGDVGPWVLLLVALALPGCGGPPPAIAARRSGVGPTAEITALAYTADGRTLVTRDANAIRVWDADSLQIQRTIPSDQSPAGTLALSPDGQTLAAPLAGRGVVTWNVADGREVGVFPNQMSAATTIPAVPQFGAGVAIAPDGQTIAGPGSAADAPAVTLYDRATGAATGLGAPGTPMTQIAFTPNGQTLVAKGIAGVIQTWDVAAHRERRTIAAGASFLTALAISPDGQLVASAGADRYLRTYRLDDASDVGKFKGHLKAILGIAYHPSGQYIATGDSGGVIFLWEVPTRQIRARLVGHEGKVWALAFRPDGTELASAGQDRRVRIWSVDQALGATRQE